MARSTKLVRQPRLIGRVADRLTSSEEELEARELQAESDRCGGTPIAGVGDRELVTVCGTVRSVTLRPRATVPALVAEIYDGSRALNLVWLGRRRITGIAPGAFLTVRGRVTHHTGSPTIFNPAYEIITGRGHVRH
ncbi:MAG TPA: OB-fold nucleic acid binding domain-containing protein [Segeticoccus sp.]|nr:OB-fold nucleic acid binding domain-containing protein [Segeticoccus sp.]